MDDKLKTLLILNGVPHFLDAVLRSVGASPTVEVDPSTINLSEGPNVNPEHVVVLRPAVTDYDDKQIVFFKQHGGFTVLLGKDKVAHYKAAGAKIIKGKLLSTPVLKKSRVPEVPQQEFRQQPEPFYRDSQEVTNRPRLRDNSSYASNSQPPQGGWRRGEVAVLSGQNPREPVREYRPSSSSYDDHQARMRHLVRNTKSI
jgi:hypothetical protein